MESPFPRRNTCGDGIFFILCRKLMPPLPPMSPLSSSPPLLISFIYEVQFNLSHSILCVLGQYNHVVYNHATITRVMILNISTTSKTLPLQSIPSLPLTTPNLLPVTLDLSFLEFCISGIMQCSLIFLWLVSFTQRIPFEIDVVAYISSMFFLISEWYLIV